MSKPTPPDDEQHPLDPIALTLAIWLGLLVSVAGLEHLAQRAPSGPAPRGVEAPYTAVAAFGG